MARLRAKRPSRALALMKIKSAGVAVLSGNFSEKVEGSSVRQQSKLSRSLTADGTSVQPLSFPQCVFDLTLQTVDVWHDMSQCRRVKCASITERATASESFRGRPCIAGLGASPGSGETTAREDVSSASSDLVNSPAPTTISTRGRGRGDSSGTGSSKALKSNPGEEGGERRGCSVSSSDS
ncbi:hypothetical protein KC357_g36 [Hortaea werneckii]|nr:hypothetical protein KC357_g36 [Hortaea werneckii]